MPHGWHGPDRLAYHSWSADGRFIYGMSVDRHAIERFSLATRRLEKVADLGAADPSAPVLSPWMGLDHLDRPMVIHSTGVEDLYVVDWEAP